jgi:hypothetical protein
MKRKIICLFVLVFGPGLMGQTGPIEGPAKKWRIAISLETGRGSWILEDFDLTKQYAEVLSEIPGFSGSTSNINGSSYYDLYLTAQYNLPRARKIGLSVGYQHYPGSTFEQAWDSPDTAFSQRLKVSAASIPVELFYKIPLSRMVFFKFAAGIDFYRGSVDYQYSESTAGETIEQEGRFKSTRLGAHFVYRAEIFLNRRLALTLRIGATICKFKDLSGILENQSGTTVGMQLVMVEDALGKYLYHHPAAAPLPPSHSPAEVNISGLRFGLGLTYYLTR